MGKTNLKYLIALIFLTLVLAAIITSAGILFFNDKTAPSEKITIPQKIFFNSTSTQPYSQPKSEQNSQQENVSIDVPFTSQAPTGNWKDARQESGCEEASALMAMEWINKTELNPIDAEREIINISDYELKTYGDYHDTSAKDTAERIFKGYFNYSNVEAKYNITPKDIKSELFKGSLVIVPVNGQKVNNPFYVPPGPIEHMILIHGYDSNTKEFITNDPGTKHGKNLRYPEEIIYQALQDYPTGYHQPIKQIVKAMIVVMPK